MKQRLIITEHALEQMLTFAQRHPRAREAGGVLLGRYLSDSHDVVVDEVSTPQPADRRTRYSFFRSHKHQQLAYDRWVRERNTSAFLGIWHTHPEQDPVPSSVDRADWQRVIACDTFEGDRLFFPIVGTQRIRVWTLTRRGVLRELKLEEKRCRKTNRKTA